MSHTLRELVETLRDGERLSFENEPQNQRIRVSAQYGALRYGIMLSHNDVAFCNLDAIAMAAETAIRKIRVGDEEGAQ